MDIEERTVPCPVDGCDYEDVPSLVAAHVNGAPDEDHDWDRLGYDDPATFVREHREGGGQYAGTPDAESAGEASADSAAESGTAGGETSDGGATESAGAPLLPERLDHVERALRREVASGDATTVGDLSLEALVDYYALLSELESTAGDARGVARDELLSRVDSDIELRADLGSVRRVTYTRRRLREEREVLERLAAAGIDRESVVSLDSNKVADAAEEAGVDSSELFDVEERARIRRSGIDAGRLRELLGE